MSKIITDAGSVNSYLRSKSKAADQVEQKRLEGLHEKRKVELEIAMDPEEREYKQKDMQLASVIGTELVHHYPGHGWQVECDIRNGVAKIFNCHMSGVYGYMLHIKDINLHTFRADIMRVGGTLLESFGVSRGKFNPDEIMSIQRDHTGSVKADI